MGETRKGKIDISELNSPPEKHEYETARYFANWGHDVMFIRPSSIKGMRSADFLMDCKVWETKSPIGKSKRTFEDNFRKAVKQSRNVIFDLRRIDPAIEKWCIAKLNWQLKMPKLKTLLVITRDGRLLILKGKYDRM